ncbi:hypothetical protein D3C76_1123990 [compost metagenome]
MHASTQFQAYIALEGDGIGADLHLLIGGDARVRPGQIRGTDAAAGEQGGAGQTLGLEGVEHQGNGVKGGEVGVEHARFRRGGARTEQLVCRFASEGLNDR